MAGSHPFTSYTVFISSLLFVCSCLNTVHGRHETVNGYVVDVQSLLPATTCSKLTPTATGLKLKASQTVLQLHKYSPCYTQNAPNHTELLLQDKARVRAINSKIRKGGSFITSNEAKLPVERIFPGSTNFYVTLGFGTPKKDLPVIIDTGSDLTWIQCQPCIVECHSGPIFDPTKSTSYSNISCNSPECGTLNLTESIRQTHCDMSACVYGMEYKDRSFSKGLFGKDTLTVSNLDVFPNFQFGCGQNNYGDGFGTTAGVLGLGRDKISFISQTYSKYKKLFSYCFPSKGIGYLSFGVPSTVAKYVPLVDKQSPFYFLDLQGISYDGKVLSIPSTAFTTSGTIIDSGTVVSRLPQKAYLALSTAFQQDMNAKGYMSAKSFDKTLTECYDFTGVTNIIIPKISLLFPGGTSLDVPEVGVLIGQDISQMCLGFGAKDQDSDVAIIGNALQQTLEVVYDVGAGRLGFGPGGCT